MADIRLKKITIDKSSPLVIQNGDVNIKSTSISNNILEGALVINGGISINTTHDTTSSTAGGSLTVGGGVGVMKSVNIGKNLTLDNSSSVFEIKGISNSRLLFKNGLLNISPDGVNKRLELSNDCLKINITSNSLNSSSGSVCIKGGVSIDSDIIATSSSEGGALTVAGGIAVGKNINISKDLILGDTNNGLTIRYTNKEQIKLINSNGSSSSINMEQNELVIENSDNIIFKNTNTNFIIGKDDTEFIKTIKSHNNIILGNQRTFSEEDSHNKTSGSITTLGGIGIGKKMYVGDSIFIDNENPHKNNKLIFYKESGLGNINQGSLSYNVSNISDDHVFFSDKKELFRISGNNNSFILSNKYEINTQDRLSLKPIATHATHQDSKDAQHGIDINNDIRIYNSNSLNKYLKIGLDEESLSYIIKSDGDSYGKSNIILESGIKDQFVLNSKDGSVIINADIQSENSSYGSLILLKGGLSINSTDNTKAFNIAGGGYIAKDLLLGGKLSLNSLFEFDTEKSDTLQISSYKNTSMSFSKKANSPNPFNINFYSYGSDEYIDNSEQFTFDSTDKSYRIYSKKNGLGNEKNIEIYSNDNYNQLVLQTSGNIGINTSDPQYKFDINGTLNCNDSVTFQNTLEIKGELSIQGTSGITIQGDMSVGKNIFIGGISNFKDNVILHKNLKTDTLEVNNTSSFNNDINIIGDINVKNSGTFNNITINSSDDNSFVSLGGVCVKNESNSYGLGTGGSLTIKGGASIDKDVFIGDNTYFYGNTHYKGSGDNIINIYDNDNANKRFSINKTDNNLSISRYNQNGSFVENSIEISSEDGNITFNNNNNINGSLSIKKSLIVNENTNIIDKLSVGGDIVFSSTTQSNDISTGSLLIAGGVGISGNLNILGNTLIVGDLIVNGKTTSVDTTNVSMKDNLLLLNSGPSGSKDSGFVIKRYQEDNNNGSGDIVNDNDYIVYNLPDQSKLNNTQIQLQQSDYDYTDWWIKITSGFSNNQTRKIVSYDKNTRIGKLSSPWTSQNPSIGDSIKLYNKPYIGLVFNETNDRFEFGSCIQNPDLGTSNLSFTEHLPILFSSAISVSTEKSSSPTSGSFTLAGGISISNTEDALSLTSGGTFTTLGGASIGKSLYIGGPVLKIPIQSTNANYVIGSIRFNSDKNSFEGFNGNWESFNNFHEGKILLDTQEYSQPMLATKGGIGSRIILEEGDNNNTPYAIGIENDNLWFSNPKGEYKWYHNNINKMHLKSDNLLLSGEILQLNNTSDINLTTNVEKLQQNTSLNIINSLKPVSFTWKDNISNQSKQNTQDIGFISQDLENIIPYAISDYTDLNTGDTHKSIKYERIIPYIVSAMQELHSEIENNKIYINQLKNNLTNLTAAIHKN